MRKNLNRAFTLMELIVSITILAILGSISFVSYNNYSQEARNSSKISNLNNASKSLSLYKITTGSLPDPSNIINISASWTIYIYQWTLWKEIQNLIWINWKIEDPVTRSEFIYSINSNKTEYQVWWFFESSTNSYLNKNIYAWNNKIFKTYWESVWIVLNEDLTQLTNSVDILTTNSWSNYNIFFTNEEDWKSLWKWTLLFNDFKLLRSNKWLSKKIKSWNLYVWDTSNPSKVINDVKKLWLNTVSVPVKINIANLTSDDFDIDLTSKNNAIEIIKHLNNLWIVVILEPYPFINNWTLAETDWNPANINNFFWNWQEKVLKVLVNEIAIPYNTYWIYIASNFVHMESAEWYRSDRIDYIKNLWYKWNIIYRTNWWKTTPKWTEVWDHSWDYLMTEYNAKLNNSIFWKVDIIAIAGYFELTSDTILVPTVEEIKTNLLSSTIYWRWQNIYQEIKNFYDKWKKPVFFWELWFPSKQKAAFSPWSNLSANIDSNEAQANCFKWYIETFWKENWFKGYSVFLIWYDNSEYSVIGKTAEQVIKNN